MNSRVFRVHPGLLDDIRAGIEYYGEQDPALPGRFVEAYAEALRRAEQHPLAGREYLSGYRRVVTVPFPYLLAYAVDDHSVYVAALLHAQRDPATAEHILDSRR